jgi:hypothetical protein
MHDHEVADAAEPVALSEPGQLLELLVTECTHAATGKIAVRSALGMP